MWLGREDRGELVVVNEAIGQRVELPLSIAELP
jgi:hypothetical protein